MIAAARFPLRSDPAMSQLSPWPDWALFSMGEARRRGSVTALPSVLGCNRVLF